MPAKGIDPSQIPERLHRMFYDNPIVDNFEMEVVSYAPGTSVLRYPYKKEFTQYQGAVQGGIVAAYADAAVAVAMRSLIPEDRDMVTTDLHVQFIRPITSGPIVARGDVVHRGKTLMLGTATVEVEGGAICARCTATYMIVDPRGLKK
jgi:uncharacterized protein (TIGR00369 family)